jgi:hypothetical protein
MMGVPRGHNMREAGFSPTRIGAYNASLSPGGAFHMFPRRVVGLLCGAACVSALGSAQAAPFSLHDALALPDWLELSVESRFRYETLDDQFRANGQGGDQVFVMRTLALLEAGSDTARVGLEMIDARAALHDAGTPLDTTQVDSAELLQAYALYRTPRTFGFGASSEFRLGRQTLDFGSRRLISRNRFRNTINAFTGLDWKLGAKSGWRTDVFIGTPVVRLPFDRPALAADDAVFDEEDFGTVVWLLGGTSAPIAGARAAGARLEAYVIGIDESDQHFATRNRRLVTPGLRLFKDPAPAQFDYQFEVVMQTGTSRADENPATLTDLDHFAHYENLQLGYTMAAAWSPRVSAMFDYASGDEDPRDRDNGRFDPLFGARRFDYGPTGIWGAFQRSNMYSPGARLNLAPRPDVRAMVGYRAFWLASDTDQWVPHRVRDTTGSSGSFVGNQFEVNASWAVVPTNVTLEAGGAYLFGGEFPSQAPNAGRDGEDSSYLYAQLTLAF